MQVVDRVDGKPSSTCDSLCRSNADDEAAGKTGTARHRDAIEFAEAALSFAQRKFDNRVDGFRMFAARDLGHDAAVRRVRSEPNGRDVPALALTGYASPTDSKRALEAGYQRHISKPVEPDELIATVTEMAHHKAAPSADEMGKAPRA